MGEPAARQSASDRLLELLAREAPAAEFHEVRRAAARAGGTEAHLRAVDAAVELALEVRSVLDRRLRREAELGALYETAGDLSSLRDLEDVLRAIVRRAQQLLATDVSYLTLIDEVRGDTFMRVTEGIRTDAFKNVRLDFGAGLGGLVAQTATPYATAHYATDDRFRHTVDEVVLGEGLVAILGVPLKLGHRVIGVLFAADRHQRPFAPEEVALLSSLAAHAAIAIENAALFSKTESAMRELTGANEIIRAHSQAVERAAAVHERLTGLILQGGEMADVAAVVATVLGGRLFVVSPTGRLVTTAGVEPDEDWCSLLAEGGLPTAGPAAEELRRALATARSTDRTERAELPEGCGRCWVTPVMAGAEHLGTVILVRDHLGDADLRTLERAAQVMALLLLNQRSMAEAEHRVRGELLDDLLATPQPEPDGLRRRAGLLGADLDRPHVVVVVRADVPENRRALAAMATSLAGPLGGLAGEHAGRVVLLLPEKEPASAAGLVVERAGQVLGSPVTAGGAGPAAGPGALSEAYADAARCVDVLLSLGRNGTAATPAELGVYGLLFHSADRYALEKFVRRTLGPVLDYDATRGTDLVRTLHAFFDADGNLARTAATLYVHVNTLYQRFDRVSTLLGPGWRHGDQALQLHLALKIQRVGATS